METKNINTEKNSMANTLYLLVAIVLLNVISSVWFFRVDLTGDKRFTLSQPTKEILKNLEGVVYVKVYLEGEMPLGFSKMKRSVIELLDEFKVHGKRYFEYELINPYAPKSAEAQEALFKELYELGLQPVNLRIKTKEGGESQKLVFPGAVISYRNAETGINLLSNNPALSAEVNLNHSVQALEYQLISIIRNITSETVEKIAFIEGHGELNEYETGDITKALANYYQVDRGVLNGQVGILDDYKAIIIAKPRMPFSEKDKFVIDQYIMKGGKVLWFIDPVHVDTDSLVYGLTLALIKELNIEDQLFRYGVRINPVLIKDLQSNYIPVNTAVAGSTQPKWTPVPWPYLPLLLGKEDHPVTRNMNIVKSEYVSPIDTLENAMVSKTVLLQTSPATKTLTVPAIIALQEIERTPSPGEYNEGPRAVAVLLEGVFISVFRNRMPEAFIEGMANEPLVQSKPNKMLVVSDGDIIRNDVSYSPRGNMISPLGFDRYTNQTFGNREFVLNAINYLTDEDGIINLRSREYKLRLLNKQKLAAQKARWQYLNILLPVALVLLFGLAMHLYRKKLYR